MSNELMISNQDERTKLIKNTVAKGATDDELSMFMHIANKYNLDPLIKEIWFIKRAKKQKDKNGEWDYKKLPNGEIDYSGAEVMMMTSRDGYLKVAQTDPMFGGIISFPIREGDEFEVDAQNYTVNHKFGTKRGAIIGAWAKVDHKNRKSVIVYADFKEYNTGITNWKQYPSAMIQKVAEVMALKRQFGISGLTTQEELTDKFEEHVNQTTVTDVTPKPQPEPQPQPVLLQPQVIESESFFPEDPPPESTELSAVFVTSIYTMAMRKGYTSDQVNNSIAKSYSVENASQLNMTQAMEFIKRLETLKDKAVPK